MPKGPVSFDTFVIDKRADHTRLTRSIGDQGESISGFKPLVVLEEFGDPKQSFRHDLMVMVVSDFCFAVTGIAKETPLSRPNSQPCLLYSELP